MALKRKRSSELFSSPSSSTTSSLTSSPPRPGSSMSMMLDGVPLSPLAAFSSFNAAPAHLPSRTMKRFRDNRPSENEVHQRTLNLLFSAQQQQQQQQQQQGPPRTDFMTSPPASTAAVQAPAAQKSLHSFWNITTPKPVASVAETVYEQSSQTASNCDDCGAGLSQSYSSGDDAMMDVDGCYAPFEADPTCGACRKAVCSRCSVTNLGEQRRCLQCAGRKAWVGGQGWTSVHMPVC